MENISTISIELGIRRMKNIGNKARCFESLDETFSDIAYKRDAHMQISEEIINFIETTNNNALKLNPQKIAWVKEWAQIKTEERLPPVGLSLREVIQKHITGSGIIKQGIIDIPAANVSSDYLPSKELLEFIIFKKRDEFSILFQTIIDNRIGDGLERAAITYIIYESSIFNSKKYHEWKPFYKQFCKDIGWYVTSYKPNRLATAMINLKSNFLWIDAIK